MMGLPSSSWPPITMVKLPIPEGLSSLTGAGFPKPLSANQVAASTRSLVIAPFSPRNRLSVGEKSFSELV